MSIRSTALLALSLAACADASGADLANSEALAAARGPRPIVLLHGMAGFDRIGPLDYFYGVAASRPF